MAIFKSYSDHDNSSNKDNVTGYETSDPDTIENLLNQIRNHKIDNFAPKFENNRGFRYPELDAYSDDLTRQLKLLHKLEAEGFLVSEFAHSILLCPTCQSSTEFSLNQSCTICSSTDIIRGSFIEHLACGNIDFDIKFVKDGNDSNNASVMMCNKCGKRLKAIGVDYARPGIFYKCLNCKALLPELTMHYTCIKCSSALNKDQLKELRLMKFNVDLPAVSRYFTENNLLPVVAEALNNLNYINSEIKNLGETETSGSNANVGDALRIGLGPTDTIKKNKLAIKATCPGKIKGLSNIEHTFGLLVSDQNNGVPLLVADLLEEKNDKNEVSNKSNTRRLETMQVLAFYAKCLDANYSTDSVIKKILVVDTKLSNDAQELADAYNVATIQSANLHDVISFILDTLGGGPL